MVLDTRDTILREMITEPLYLAEKCRTHLGRYQYEYKDKDEARQELLFVMVSATVYLSILSSYN